MKNKYYLYHVFEEEKKTTFISPSPQVDICFFSGIIKCHFLNHFFPFIYHFNLMNQILFWHKINWVNLVKRNYSLVKWCRVNLRFRWCCWITNEVKLLCVLEKRKKICTTNKYWCVSVFGMESAPIWITGTGNAIYPLWERQ